jgi:hypothetical protein
VAGASGARRSYRQAAAAFRPAQAAASICDAATRIGTLRPSKVPVLSTNCALEREVYNGD